MATAATASRPPRSSRDLTSPQRASKTLPESGRNRRRSSHEGKSPRNDMAGGGGGSGGGQLGHVDRPAGRPIHTLTSRAKSDRLLVISEGA